MWTVKFQMFKLVLEKAEEPEINCQHPLDHGKSKRVPDKHLFLLYWHAKAFGCVDHNKLWKTLKKMGIPDTWPASWEICMQVRKQQNWTWNNRLVPQEKEYIKAVYCHPAYLTSMQSTSWDMLGWMKHKLELRLPGKIPVTTKYADYTSLMEET